MTIADRFGSLIYLLLLGALIATTVVMLYRGRFGRALRDAVLWLFIMSALVVGYAFRADLNIIGQRVFATLVPGYAVSSEDGKTLEFVAGPDRHFLVKGKVNDTTVTFVADTGATTVLLSHDDAVRVGIDLEDLSFRLPVQTANGMTLAAPYRIKRLSVGEISRTNVSALIAQPGMTHTSLLGMSFLGRLSSFEVRGDRLVLRD
jgi:aspartyl protease family protein